MCGIFCHIGNNYETQILHENFDKIKDRGPDYNILKCINNVYLGFHRLAINDLSSNGNQPFHNNGVYLICNGEIYNYKQLAIDNNFDLETGSDCEIVLHMFQKYGIEETCKKLDGVFAFCIWDSDKEEMSVGRDPIGVRSLYMGICEDGVAISSELKSLQSLAHNVMPFLPGCYWSSKSKETYPISYYTYEYPLIEFILL